MRKKRRVEGRTTVSFYSQKGMTQIPLTEFRLAQPPQAACRMPDADARAPLSCLLCMLPFHFLPTLSKREAKPRLT